jgi:hypothetical protein
MKKQKTLYHFVLDKWVYEQLRETTIMGFNTQLKTIQRLQNRFPAIQYH